MKITFKKNKISINLDTNSLVFVRTVPLEFYKKFLPSLVKIYVEYNSDVHRNFIGQ